MICDLRRYFAYGSLLGPSDKDKPGVIIEEETTGLIRITSCFVLRIFESTNVLEGIIFQIQYY
jgi:hypothetical protein